MIASMQITNTEIFAFIAALVFKLLSRKEKTTEKKTETEKHYKQKKIINT